MVQENLQKCIADTVCGMGYEFIGCEWQTTGRAVLCIYIDKEGGITLSDCTAVSRQISAILDVEGEINGHYQLEISSPGINRPLFNIDQYQKQLNKTIYVKLKNLLEGRRQFKGKLLEVMEDGFSIETEEGRSTIPFVHVAKAHVVSDEFDNTKNSGKKGRSRETKRLNL